MTIRATSILLASSTSASWSHWHSYRSNEHQACDTAAMSRWNRGVLVVPYSRAGREGEERHLWQEPFGRLRIRMTRTGGIWNTGFRDSGASPFTLRPFSNPRSRIVASSIIGPNFTEGLFTALTSCAALGQVLETRTRWGGQVSGPVLAMGAGVALSAAGVLPSASPIYDMVFSTIMPVGAALTLLETDVWSAFDDAGSTLKAFWFGAIGTILGTVVSFKVLGPFLGQDGWKIAASLCASYVGGTINYAATAQVLDLQSVHLLAAGMAADNLAMALYFGVIMSIPDGSEKSGQHRSVDSFGGVESKAEFQPTVESLVVSLATALVACFLGNSIASLLPSSLAGSGLAFMALFASIFNALAGQFFRGAAQANIPIFAGSQKLGGAVMLLFFAVVGASTGLKDAMTGGWPLPMFITVLIVVHLATVISLGWWSKLPMRTILIASNANIGGPATASAMANARSWPQLVRPALLVGTLGYTIGTAVGCMVGVYLLRPMVKVLAL